MGREENDVPYEICVESGDKPKGLCRGIIYIKLLGKDEDGEDVVGEEEELSVAKFPEDFKRGHKNFFNVVVPETLEMNGIEIRGDAMVGKGGWNIDKVIVTHLRTGFKTVFPIFTNITCGDTFQFKTNDLVLPQRSDRSDIRKKDLKKKRDLYKHTDEYLRECPPRVKCLPTAEDVSLSRYKLKVGWNLGLKTVGAMLSKSGPDKEFHTFKDLEAVFNNGLFPAPSNLNRWKNDELFGMQRLMSVNPVMIRLCTKIPDKLDVTNEDLEVFLENKLLPDAVKSRRIFIIDYEILDGIPTKPGYVMTAPIALFYRRNDGKLVPIAIQLYQKSGPNNPVFFPNDPQNTWILAKMWFNVADANYHQSVTHLGFTHLKMEGIVVCTHRQIHKDHPIFALLMPHFLYLLAINSVGIELLLGEDGYVSKILNIGKEGMEELIKRRNRKWRMNIEGTLPEDLKDRGVDKPDLLPEYYYRDDAEKLYEVIFKYVTKYLDLYYTSDDDVQNDNELQDWRKEMADPVDKEGLGMLGVFGENDKFTNKEQVCLTLTSIIFTCSVQHAAANFRQYEDYAFTPNFPLCLRGSPPKSKTEKDELELVQHLPQKDTTYDILVITDVLSTNSMHALGDFEVKYIHDKRALEVVEDFRIDLAQIAKTIKGKNNTERTTERYNCLNPTRVPNSISI